MMLKAPRGLRPLELRAMCSPLTPSPLGAAPPLPLGVMLPGEQLLSVTEALAPALADQLCFWRFPSMITLLSWLLDFESWWKDVLYSEVMSHPRSRCCSRGHARRPGGPGICLTARATEDPCSLPGTTLWPVSRRHEAQCHFPPDVGPRSPLAFPGPGQLALHSVPQSTSKGLAGDRRPRGTARVRATGCQSVFPRSL